MILQPVITEDGSSTLFVPELNEHYHSIHGAIQESMHIFIGAGYKEVNSFPVNILEVGYGTGLNAFLTFLESKKDRNAEVNYTAIEKYPLQNDIVHLLNYPGQINRNKTIVFQTLHSASWEKKVRISEKFTLRKIQCDITCALLPDNFFELVYFDAFGPDIQPELWTEYIFRKIYKSMTNKSFLVTYSVKGTVTRALKAAGFSIEKLPGPPGKREITRATKKENRR